ncbi:MAG: VTT domain-containing protein [Balneolaceae bacterium]|nr:VTT domain-containing protein [Balneolaceae bacterium]MBO6546170.1 VTT domain-containing protein [Balneolaceae bacterium]MBO6648528.1 VTT domain-containing protein [Balneolaceae bacterium]
MSLREASKKHIWKLFIVAYLLLLLISNAKILLTPDSVDIIQPQEIPDKPVLLYFPDPVFDHNVVNDEIRYSYQVIEWNYSSTTTPSSAITQAFQANKFLDSLQINSVHVLGEGIGGRSALRFVSEFPGKAESLSLLGANGVVELELMRGYHLNRAVYGAKYSFFVLLKYTVPHFGLFKQIGDRIQRANIQYQSDRRFVRTELRSIEIPVLIQHFTNSRIPEEVSREHSRLIPQSTLLIYKNNKSDAQENLLSFLEQVDAQPYITEISTLREVQSLLPFDPSNGIQAEGKALIILMIIIILSTLISEDLTCIGTGLMIARGLIGFFPGVFACLFGIFIGDILLYLTGRWLASSTLHKAPLKWFISKKDVEQSYHWFQAKGPAIIIASRFIPGTRLPTYFSAGAIGASFWMFILYFGIASLIWTPILVGMAVLVGNEMIGYFNIYQDYALWVLGGFLIAAYILFKILIPMLTFRGRRVLIGKWKRIMNWEFWPPYIIYGFVLVYVFTLWIKHKSITIFTLANPAIPEGGFIKESKKGILDGIGAKESVACYELINKDDSSASKKEQLEFFLASHQLSYPIVLKPDVGERGRGVRILKNEEELENVLCELNRDYIIQEFIDGEEYGIFYYRFPDAEKGTIFSITKKVYLHLKGDGTHTLEELILKDSRAVCMAEFHFDQHINDLYKIPEEGERIKLVELGTHALGAVFYDGNDLITSELTKEINRISRSFDGFYFGRYDIKVPSEDYLRRGEKIKVIEVNGVTSESTNVYDPKHSFFFAAKTLMKQWKICYEIGSQLKTLNPNLKAPSVSHLLSLLR